MRNKLLNYVTAFLSANLSVGKIFLTFPFSFSLGFMKH